MEDLQSRLQDALGDWSRIERELGRGGTGIVFLATDTKHDRRVALKVLSPEIGGSVGSEPFLREIRISARLTHPNILTPVDSGEAEGLLFYVMPCVARSRWEPAWSGSASPTSASGRNGWPTTAACS